MNAAVYAVLCAGTQAHETAEPQPAHRLPMMIPTAGRAGFAYDQTTAVNNNQRAIEQFTAAFYGPGSPDTGGLLLLNQVADEFAGANGRKVVADVSPTQRKITGTLTSELLYKIIEPPPEIIRERHSILYSYAGQVLVQACYPAGGIEHRVTHCLLTLSRNAYSPHGGVPTVQVGIPTRGFRWADEESGPRRR